MKSIQMKLTVTILVIFLVALGALGGLNYWKAREIISEKVTADMQQQAVGSAIAIGDWLEAHKMELKMLASNPILSNGSLDSVVPILVAAKNNNKEYDSLVFADQNGDSVNETGFKVNVADRPYFKPAMSGQIFISDPVASKATGHLTIVIAIPVKAGDKVVGVLLGPIDMDELSKRVLDIKIGQTGYVYVCQKDGLAIIHPDPNVAMKSNFLTDPNADPGRKAMAARMVTGEKGTAIMTAMGIDRYYAYAPVPGVSWSLGVTVPKAEVTDAVSALTWVSLITAAAVLLLAAIVIAWYARRMVIPIRTMVAYSEGIANGDLRDRGRMIIYSQDEIGQLADSLVRMRGNLHGLIKQVSAATDQVAASSEELTASAEQSAQAANQIAQVIGEVATGAENQLKAVDNTSAVVGQMSAGIQQIAANANTVANTSAKSAEAAKEGSNVVQKAITQMGHIEETVTQSAQVVTKLSERSQEIGQIVNTISGIAGQTNLLALNAAIEAARAGEQGRGFAVVAEEVRKLAEQSQDAAKKIAELIAEIQGDTDSAVVAMNGGTREVRIGAEVVNDAGKAFQAIYGSINEVSAQMREISAVIQQMASGSQQIVTSVREVDAISKSTAGQSQTVSAASEEQSATMEEIASSSQALARMAGELTQAVSKFRV
ncbi:MAG TPA: methyl-accepting chemotaxis protein [Methylomusa anaerophila]|uniref:Methyl-accepting chemotaxis protein McpB n=1 Tax=Methylomusa anaerophila TaxID=1930071 RepID=A0A348AGH2_9FIRM|nr:methyl-accepting chemotaxis protein [Methylomusa anaerophila]BBB90170.1 methyl-accepting chemotaxis protein McpB [Methylomusa anaerophila]HML88104.1 methyl-accepting chemotaxis protein [Methylomusa anaerophila]